MEKVFYKEDLYFWGYFAGLIEADGFLKITKRTQTDGCLIVIAGHSAQLKQFCDMGERIRKPFTLSAKGNNSRIILTNPLALEHIVGRLLTVLNYNSRIKLLLPKLSKFEDSLKNMLSVENLYKYKKSLIQNRNSQFSLIDTIILSVVIGFIDGDGEMNISINPSNHGKTSNNIIDGSVKISQKNPKVLEIISQELSTILNRLAFSEGCYPLKDAKIYMGKKVDRGASLQLNAVQNYLFTKYIDNNCFKNPWNCLGADLIFIIHEFKKLYDFRKMGPIARKKRPPGSLDEWVKKRANLITFAQLLRIACRDPGSQGMKHLISRLNETNGLELQQGDFDCNKISLESHLFNVLSFILLKNKKPKAKPNWERLIAPIFIENELVNQKEMSGDRLDSLKQRIIGYIQKSIKYISFKKEINEYVKSGELLQTTYYPSEAMAKKSLRNFNWGKKALFKVTLFGKATWYKTQNVLK